jgi:pimeloyl-ACP methyl ester carboxylesterase
MAMTDRAVAPCRSEPDEVNMKPVSTSDAARAGASTRLAAAAAVAAGAMAVWTSYRARKAERENPPTGGFLEIDGTRLHYIERGSGPPVVLLHGNGALLGDFRGSALIDELSTQYRVIAFDRPGSGYSDRPRNRIWTPAYQAELVAHALEALGVDKATIVGHSLGALVAAGMGVLFPERVRALVLISGYYYPTVRLDSAINGLFGIPVFGDVMCYTLAAAVARLLYRPAMKIAFSPKPISERFLAEVDREIVLRPSQLRASSADAGLMIVSAASFGHRYSELRMPVAIIAGDADKIIAFRGQSERLHHDVPGSTLLVVPGAGHMLHYAAAPAIVSAVADRCGHN